MKEPYRPQVTASHYQRGVYYSIERWNSYWHQIDLVRKCIPKNLLEVGVGRGVVAEELRKDGIKVNTLDIAQDLSPDIVGSITAIPAPDKSYDAVLAAEVLEHIVFEDVHTALREIARVGRAHAIISIPHPGYIFSLSFKIPLLPKINLDFKIPFFWKTHEFNGEHYWELGKRGYPVQAFLQAAKNAGLELVETRSYSDDPVHRFFVFSIT